jgi:hypothetical protein
MAWKPSSPPSLRPRKKAIEPVSTRKLVIRVADASTTPRKTAVRPTVGSPTTANRPSPKARSPRLMGSTRRSST